MIISLLLTIAVVFVVATYVVYRMCFYSDRKEHETLMDGEQYKVFSQATAEMVKKLAAREYEEMWVKSTDGLYLYGRYYAGEKDKPTAICFHGYKGTDLRDFSGGSDILFSLGWNVLLVSQRSHGRSEGKTITFGIKEKLDLLEWVKKIDERGEGNGKVFLFGISMGGATVLMASGLDLPPSVKGIIADCPYSSAVDIIRKVASKDMGIPPFLVMPLVHAAARIWGGFVLDAETAQEAVERTKVPILVIHGLEDRFVPDCMSQVVEEANPKMVHRETFPGAGHGLSFMVDEKRYRKLVVEFLEENS